MHLHVDEQDALPLMRISLRHGPKNCSASSASAAARAAAVDLAPCSRGGCGKNDGIGIGAALAAARRI